MLSSPVKKTSSENISRSRSKLFCTSGFCSMAMNIWNWYPCRSVLRTGIALSLAQALLFSTASTCSRLRNPALYKATSSGIKPRAVSCFSRSAAAAGWASRQARPKAAIPIMVATAKRNGLRASERLVM